MPTANKANVATLIVFLKCFVGFVIVVPLAVLIGLWDVASWPDAMLIALFTGVPVASILTFMHVGRMRRLGAEPRLWSSVRQSRAVALSLPCEETIRLVDGAARAWGWKVRRADPSGRTMTAVTRMSWQSWGERVSVTARPVGAGCEVEVSSRPLIPVTSVDYGTNFVNVQHLIAFLNERTTGPAGNQPVGT